MFPHEVLLGEVSTQGHPLGLDIFQCFLHIPKIKFKRAFPQWVERLRNCVAADGEYSEKLQEKKVVCGEDNTLCSMYFTLVVNTFCRVTKKIAAEKYVKFILYSVLV